MIPAFPSPLYDHWPVTQRVIGRWVRCGWAAVLWVSYMKRGQCRVPCDVIQRNENREWSEWKVRWVKVWGVWVRWVKQGQLGSTIRTTLLHCFDPVCAAEWVCQPITRHTQIHTHTYTGNTHTHTHGHSQTNKQTHTHKLLIPISHASRQHTRPCTVADRSFDTHGVTWGNFMTKLFTIGKKKTTWCQNIVFFITDRCPWTNGIFLCNLKSFSVRKSIRLSKNYLVCLQVGIKQNSFARVAILLKWFLLCSWANGSYYL